VREAVEIESQIEVIANDHEEFPGEISSLLDHANE